MRSAYLNLKRVFRAGRDYRDKENYAASLDQKNTEEGIALLPPLTGRKDSRAMEELTDREVALIITVLRLADLFPSPTEVRRQYENVRNMLRDPDFDYTGAKPKNSDR
jgi:hypothetical protein